MVAAGDGTTKAVLATNGAEHLHAGGWCKDRDIGTLGCWDVCDLIQSNLTQKNGGDDDGGDGDDDDGDFAEDGRKSQGRAQGRFAEM